MEHKRDFTRDESCRSLPTSNEQADTKRNVRYRDTPIRELTAGELELICARIVTRVLDQMREEYKKGGEETNA